MNEELTDKEYLENIHDNLHDLVAYCIRSKDKMEDMDNWRIVHDIEFHLELAFKKLRRYLAKMEIEE